MLVEARELHKKLNIAIDKAYGLYLDGLIFAQLLLNELESETMKQEVKDMEGK